MKRHFIDTSKGTMHFITEGSGDAVICLHSIPMSSCEYKEVLPALGKSFHAIALDSLGYGDSEKPIELLEIFDHAQSVVEFADLLGIKTFNIIGKGAGAAIAAEVAASFPDRVSSLILLTYPLYTNEMLESRKREIPIAIRDTEPFIFSDDGSHLFKAFARAKAESGTDRSSEYINDVVIAIIKSGVSNIDSHKALWRYADRQNVEKRLAAVKCPTLAISTAGLFGDTKMDISRLISDCVVKHTEKPIIWEPELFVNLATQFIKEQTT